MKEENASIIEELPGLENTIVQLENELNEVKKQNRAISCYYALDVDKTVIFLSINLPIEFPWLQINSSKAFKLR